MIYVIIARKSELVGGRVKKYAPLLSKSINEYVSCAACDTVREDRLAGYTLLSLACAMLLESSVLIPTGDSKMKNIKEGDDTLKLRHIPRLTAETIEKYSLDLAELKVSRTPAGKPYINDIGICFNLSHSGDVVALAINTDGEVGADVQLEIDTARAERLSSRFFTNPIVTETLDDVEYLYVTADDGGIIFQDAVRDDVEHLYVTADDGGIAFQDAMRDDAEGADFSVSESANTDAATSVCETLGAATFSNGDEYTARWSAGEAILKCDGRGFEALPEIDKISRDVSTKTVKLSSEGKKYSLTVAAKKCNVVIER